MNTIYWTDTSSVSTYGTYYSSSCTCPYPPPNPYRILSEIELYRRDVLEKKHGFV